MLSLATQGNIGPMTLDPNGTAEYDNVQNVRYQPYFRVAGTTTWSQILTVPAANGGAVTVDVTPPIPRN